MSTTEIIVLVGGLVLGYWIVSKILGAKPVRVVYSNFQHSAPDTPPHESFEEGPISSTWFRILGVPEHASRDEIVRAYKTRISQYHPDKVMQLGEDIRALAEHKSKLINMAYDYAVRRYD